MLLLIFTGVLNAERVFELSNAISQDNDSFAEKVIDGKIKWNVFYEIRKSDYVGTDDYLKKIGQFLKDYPSCTITVKSYADKGTGNAKLNIMYSRLRNEKAVAALVAAGVDPKLIQASYYGDTVQPFAENDKNRLTIIEASGLKVVNEKKETEPATPKTEVTTPVEKTPIVETTPVVEEKKTVTETTPVVEEKTPVTETTPVVEEKTPVTEEQHAVATVSDESSIEDQATEAAKNNYETLFTPKSEKAKSYKGHWFIGANVGAQMYIGDHNRQMDNKFELITPAADIYVGYWFNRFIGARFDVGGFNIKGLTNSEYEVGIVESNPFTTGEVYQPKKAGVGKLERQRFNYVNSHIDLLINLMQIKKNGDDILDLIPYAGYGWSFAWSPYHHKNHTEAWGFDVGLILGWHVAKHWTLHTDFRGRLIPDRFDGDGFNNGRVGRDRNNKYEGIPQLNVGLSYTF